MSYYIIIVGFVAAFLFIFNLLLALNKDKLRLQSRVNEIIDMDEKKAEQLEGSFANRALKPLYNYISKTLIKITPKQRIRNLSKRLEAAGLLKTNNVEKWLYKSYMIIFIFSVFCGLTSYQLNPSIGTSLLITLLCAVLIMFVMHFNISKKISQRKRNILRSLPFTLDLITVSVEAGLSFDGAIARVIENIAGELSDEFAKTLKEMKMGIERKTALKNMSDRCDVKELSTFVNSLIQADSLGVSLGKVLRIEAASLRESRKQAAREKAMKAPVKMLFPLIIFIFPAIFVIILGPAAIKMIEIFKG